MEFKVIWDGQSVVDNSVMRVHQLTDYVYDNASRNYATFPQGDLIASLESRFRSFRC